jgi:hypothetical protein
MTDTARKPPGARGIIRFFYLNAYAFLLAVSISMLIGWKNKRRVMAVMLGRNKKSFRPSRVRKNMAQFAGLTFLRTLVKS